MTKIIEKLVSNPEIMFKVHAWQAIIWFFLSFPIMIWFRDSIILIVFMSAYAIVYSAIAAAQATRTEIKQQETDQKIEEKL